MKVIAIVGMAGSGKSEVTRIFEDHGYKKVRFGDLTDEEIARRGLELNEANERTIRQQLRQEHGMAAYAELNLPIIDSLLKTSNVVIDGLYSWEEYIVLKKHFGDEICIIAVFASPAARYDRLMYREHRPLTAEESRSRDEAEIENINKGGPIAMADFTIINNSSLVAMEEATKNILATLK